MAMGVLLAAATPCMPRTHTLTPHTCSCSLAVPTIDLPPPRALPPALAPPPVLALAHPATSC